MTSRALFLAATLALFPLAASAAPAAPGQLLVYGHAYYLDQNGPIAGAKVTVSRGGKAIASATSDRSGLWQALVANTGAFLDLCLEAPLPGGGEASFCETASAFQLAPKSVAGVPAYRLEHDFFAGRSGENLNQRFEGEITHSDAARDLGEYEGAVAAAKDAEALAAAAKAKAAEDEALKARYRMPPNTAMTGPLKSMRVVGTVASASGAEKLDPFTVTATAYGGDGRVLGTAVPGRYGDFYLELLPPGDAPFLTPAALKVSSSAKSLSGGSVREAYRDSWHRLASETTVVNARLEPFVPGPLEEVVPRPAPFPWLLLPAIALAAASFLSAVVMARLRTRRHDA